MKKTYSLILQSGFLFLKLFLFFLIFSAKNPSLSFKDIEIGAQYFRVGNMTGLNYAFDRVQTIPTWIEEDYHHNQNCFL